MPLTPTPDEIVPWRYGPAQCLQCATTWIGAWPLGHDNLHCPVCSSTDTVRDMEGHFANERQYTWRLTC